MRYAGAVIIRSFTSYFRVEILQTDRTIEENVFINFPFADLLGILT